MKNKLGLTEYQLELLERKIINLKLNLLDYTYTFNHQNLDFSYLCDLHKYLFLDFYYEEDLNIRTLTKEEIDYVDLMLNKIQDLCIDNNKEKVLSLLKEIWSIQPFIIGNTRTLIAYLKVLDDSFMLGLDIDLTMEIKSKPSIFNIKGKVNQKRLTK